MNNPPEKNLQSFNTIFRNTEGERIPASCFSDFHYLVVASSIQSEPWYLPTTVCH